MVTMYTWLFSVFCLIVTFSYVHANALTDIKLDEKARGIHRIDSENILAYVCLLILTVCTIWLFKRKRARFLHETGLAIIYGLVIGAIIRYSAEDTEISFVNVKPTFNNVTVMDLPPDSLFFTMKVRTGEGDFKTETESENKTYAYVFRGEITDVESQNIDQKATFDPEIFFNIILPPIIFNAGYSLKRRFFFRNLGAIMTFAFIGTTISCFVVGGVVYGFVQLMPHLEFSFNDSLYFGAIISATDPVTVLAIFHDLHVDVNLYAMVFGESILNDAVAIVLSGAINNYEEHYHTVSGFEVGAAFKSLGNFVYIFVCSFLIGSVTGCCTALLTKFTRLCDFSLLESSLFVLMSYSTFLMAESADLSGIVAVLFCGICQAHYTFNNLSDESRVRTKQFFELLNFIAESFIFTYIGVSMFTYQKHRWDVGFILVSFFAIIIGRAVNIYPLSFLLNLGRNNKIPCKFQHMLFFSGLRGAMAFALAIRNTMSESRHLMLTTTSLISTVTVIICGGGTTQLLSWLGIPVGIEEEQELHPFSSIKQTSEVSTPTDLRSPPPGMEIRTPHEKAWLVRKWYNFDVMYMKPFLTHSQPTLIETLPSCCLPLARILTTTQQLSHDITNNTVEDSDVDVCIGDNIDVSGSRKNHQKSSAKFEIEGTNGAAPYGPPQTATSVETQSVDKTSYEEVVKNNTVYDSDLGLGGGLAQLNTTKARIPGIQGDLV